MPELPELEIIKEVLQRHVVGETIADVQIRPPGGPIVVRDLTGQGFAAGLAGQIVAGVSRRGKFLLFDFRESPRHLAINPKLTGRLQLAEPGDKKLPKTHIIFTLGNGRQLRYIDQKQMGQLYLTENPDMIPDFAGLGPEALEVSFDDFRLRLKPFRGEIKGVLTRGEFVAGIGNAYADEILWTARLHPFRKRTQLTPEEVQRLYEAMRSALLQAIERVRILMGENIQQFMLT